MDDFGSFIRKGSDNTPCREKDNDFNNVQTNNFFFKSK